jgi:hypothetical protein
MAPCLSQEDPVMPVARFQQGETTGDLFDANE